VGAPRFWLGLLLTSIALFHTPRTRAANATPAEAFGAIPAISAVELSPNGKLIAWHDAKQGSSIVIFDLDAHRDRRKLAFESGVKLRALTWADDETLLLTVSSFATYGERDAAKHYEVFRTYAADVSGNGKPRMLLMGGGDRQFVTGADLLAWRTDKPKTVIMSSFDFSGLNAKQQTGSHLAVGRKEDGWVSQVFEVDTRTGKGVRVAMGTAFTLDWVIDAKGEPVARSEWNPATGIFSISAHSGLSWNEIFRDKDHGARTMYGLTADGKAILISATSAADRKSLWMLPLDGSEGHPLLEDATSDISEVNYDRITRVPVSVSLGGVEQERRWLDAESERRFRRIAGAFKGKRVSVYGRSEDGKRVLAEVEAPSSPPVYYFVDLAKGTADIVGEAYPQLADAPLGEVRIINYKARDGAAVPAYLTLPPGSPGKALPLIVLPHGGPEAHDDYASTGGRNSLPRRAMPCFQAQFRGSTGFGEAWRLAGYRQWGLRMQDDVTDGVKAMIDQGIADATRVCIVGASYGGYAALAGAAFTPDLYRCAVSVNGVSDLPQMLTYEKNHAGAESDTLAYWREHIGSGFDPQVIARSPLRAASQIKAPVMLMHAVNDTVVPQSQSEAMSRELDTLKKKVTYVRLPGEDHWLSQSPTRIRMLEELQKFLAEQLRPAAAGAP
jgi:dipeptidyl aminopeptidase/acylaminoacyl peptidase